MKLFTIIAGCLSAAVMISAAPTKPNIDDELPDPFNIGRRVEEPPRSEPSSRHAQTSNLGSNH